MATYNKDQFADGDFNVSIAAAGTTQATATELTADHCIVTTATAGSATGVVINDNIAQGQKGSVANASGVVIEVYPPSGYKFNAKTANLPINLPDGTALSWRCVSNDDIIAIY